MHKSLVPPSLYPRIDFKTGGGKLHSPVHFKAVSQSCLVSHAGNFSTNSYVVFASHLEQLSSGGVL